MKKVTAIILASVLTLALAGCGNQEVQTEASVAETSPAQEEGSGTEEVKSETETAEEGRRYTFGISMPQLDNDGFKANLIGIQQFAEENNIELVVTDGKATADTQMQNIEDLITKEVDALVMCPVDSGAAAAAVKKAQDA